MIEYSLYYVDLSLSKYFKINELVYKFVTVRIATSTCISLIRGCTAYRASSNFNAYGSVFNCVVTGLY